ncbi:MAG TPA: SMP-30/gluconolactonase/LRE family protein [Vicinamibacteria bacterium]|nr:SMP-30/gluconolactonase/LRE family protein [Vicinamibacteria bacterium]
MKRLLLLGAALASLATDAGAQALVEPAEPQGPPAATLDLHTKDGVAAVKGAWRYSDARVVEVGFKAAGADGQPTGAAIRTNEIEPHAGGADFDDSAWPVLDPTTLQGRRGSGRVSFNWYRIAVTIPERVGAFETKGATLVFETSLDDYAEIWVDGEMPRRPGQSGGSVVAGWNATNRLVVGRNVRPGQRIQLAVFGINGPLSNPPTNYIWMRFARLLFYRENAPGPYAVPPHEVNVEVVRADPALDAIVPANPKIHKLAEGFLFTEGPVWVDRDGGYLLFSDPNANRIYKYTAAGELTVFREPSGYAGADVAEYGQPGSNGLALDAEGRLTIDQHGNRRVVRVEADGRETVIADRYQGRRLNSPNDLVYRSDGTLFLTDPPFGLPKFHDDPRRETPHFGVYAVVRGRVKLLTTEFRGPNGIALSPDEKFLYVGNWDEKDKVVKRFEVRPDGSLANGMVFYDLTSAPGEDAVDGVKVDRKGNVYVSGPGGLWVISPEGKHLGTIRGPRHVHNMAWGDADGRTLYLCARTGLYRMRLNVQGAGIRPSVAAIERKDARLDRVLPKGAAVEALADGYAWVEGPVWNREDRYLLFSDIPNNRIVKWQEDQGASDFLKPSGYTGAAPFAGREPGSNGLTYDREGRLVMSQHGNRGIVRVEKDGSWTTLVDRYEGKRLNSPNDLVYRSDGSLYFTDPPFGLPRGANDTGRELPFAGVYRLAPDGALTLLTKDLACPNGLAFSPDEKTLYVANADLKRPLWVAYEVKADGTLGAGRQLFDASAWAKEGQGVPDGLKVDVQGNLWAGGPGGRVFVIAPDGALLGTLNFGVPTANLNWGDDGSTLYIASNTRIARLRTTTRGATWGAR